MPVISVIVPVYNAEKYLRTCLDSIVNQTYKNLEIILVDDGSTDGSGAICDEYADKDVRIKVIHSTNKGVTAARINAFKTSSGDYITFVDADDFLDCNMFKKMLDTIMEDNTDIIVCQYINYDSKTKKQEKSMLRPPIGIYYKEDIVCLVKKNFLYNEKTGMAEMPPFLWAKLIKREFVQEILNVEVGLSYNEDQVGIFALLLRINSMSIIQDYFYYYRHHSVQATAVYTDRLWERIADSMQRFRELDSSNYLVIQLPQKCFMMLFECTTKAIKCGIDIKTVNKEIDKYLSSLPNTIDAKFCKRKNKIKVFIVKYRMTNALKYIFFLKKLFGH